MLKLEVTPSSTYEIHPQYLTQFTQIIILMDLLLYSVMYLYTSLSQTTRILLTLYSIKTYNIFICLVETFQL